MASLAEVATRHMAAGVEDLDELARLCEQETGKAPSVRSLMSYRSNFRRHGADWLGQRDPEARREANRKWFVANAERVREVSRDWHKDNPERNRDAQRRWEEKNPDGKRQHSRQWKRVNAAKWMLSGARGNAKARGREVTITEAEVEALLAPGVCALTGLPFYGDERGLSRSGRDPWAPSLDRIDCSRGYEPGNVRVVCWIVNYMRGDYADEVVAKAARALADALQTSSSRGA